MNGGKTYLKQYNKNTAIRACTNLIKTCHGHVLNVRFSATLWTFHFETYCKVHNYGVAEMYVETRISNEPGYCRYLTTCMLNCPVQDFKCRSVTSVHRLL